MRSDRAPHRDVLELYGDRAIEGNAEQVEVVREALIEHNFCRLTGWTEQGGQGRFARDLDRHAYARHDCAMTYIVPWVNRAFPLSDARIVEIGCGTGSSTAAFAPFSNFVYGYDISPSSIAAAKVRLNAHGLADRTTLIASPLAQVLESIERSHTQDPVDVVLMFALLEHQKVDERFQTPQLAERIVKPGVSIVVTETPNRLTYIDRRTSQLPFFHLLPIELQLLYADRLPRPVFADNVRAHRDRGASPGELHDLLVRWGQSVSFHDFDVAIGDINHRILSSGLHPNLIELRPEMSEELVRHEFLRTTDLLDHPGFARYYLDLVIAT